MAYLMKTDIVLLEPAELMSGRFTPYLQDTPTGTKWCRRTVCCEFEQRSTYVTCRNPSCPQRTTVPGSYQSVPVEFAVMYKGKVLMLAHGKYAEGMTQSMINDMQYNVANKIDKQWLFTMHDTNEENLQAEAKAHDHACRRTAAVNDSRIKVLTEIL